MNRLLLALGLVVVGLSAAQAQVASPQPSIPPELALDRTLPIDPAVIAACVAGSVLGLGLFAITVSINWQALPWAAGGTIPLVLLFAARLIDGVISWSVFESGKLTTKGSFVVKGLEMVELLSLGSGEAPLTEESQGACRLRLVGSGEQQDVPFADAERARRWMDELMARSRCEL